MNRVFSSALSLRVLAAGAASLLTLTACPKAAGPDAGAPATAKLPEAAVPALAGSPVPPPPPPPLSPEELEMPLYALGVDLANRIEVFTLTEAELGEVVKGLSDRVSGKPSSVAQAEYLPKLQQLARERQEVKAAAAGKVNAELLERLARDEGYAKAPSGLLFKDVKAGTGPSPTAADKVKVHYRGTLLDGTEFDSSYKRGEPAEFPLRGVIPCWTEGVQKIKVGGKAQLVCPPAIAYGEGGTPGIPPNSILKFEVELLSIQGKE